MLTYAATLANGQALPEWLTFDGAAFTGAPPSNFNGTMAIRVVASDGIASVSDSFVLAIRPVNDAPVLAAPFADLAIEEDTVLSVALDSSLFSDVDGDSLVTTLTLANGTELPAWLHFDGTSIAGVPPRDFNGSIALTITASDGEYSVSDSFTLTMRPVNDAPVLGEWFAATVRTREDTAIDLALPDGAFSDVDGDALAITATLADGSALPSWLAFDGMRFTGTPPANYNGALALMVTASDGVATTVAGFTLAIDPVNDAPILFAALPDVSTSEDSAITVAIPLASFADVDGDMLTLSARLADGSALPGWLALDGATLNGTPPLDFHGALDIEILASDGRLTASDVFRLTITPINDAPAILVALADLVTAEDHAISLPVPFDGITDVDGDALTFAVTQADGNALPDWLSFANGRLVGTPPANFNGVLSLQLIASDGQAQVADVFDFTILAVNDAPVLLRRLPNLRSLEDQTFAFAIDKASFADVDGDALTLSARLADGTPLSGWLTFDGTTLVGVPPRDFNGALAIRVTATDGLLAASSDFTLALDPVNDAPRLLAPLVNRASAEDTAFSFSIPAGTFGDADGDGLYLTATLAGGAALPAWLQFDGSMFSGTPPQNLNGSFDILVTASDGALSASSGFRFTVSPVNDAPVVVMPLVDQVIAAGSAVDWTVPANIVGIGAGFFAEFVSALQGQEPDIGAAMSLVLASLALFGLGIFGPGIASGLVAGAPQLGAGSAVATTALAAGAFALAGGAGVAAARGTQEAAEAGTPVASGLAVERLDFNYAISGDKPAWRPLRAFDDGRQTFIEFPASIAVGEAPPLFVVGEKGEAQLVNYRVAGRYYVVDRLFDTAELRLGEKKQAVVRIARGDGRSSKRRRGS